MSLCEPVSFQSVGLPTWEVWGFSYHIITLLPLDVASYLSSGVIYLFESFWSIWLKVAQHVVVNCVIFRREVELQSFYSAILILSQKSTQIIHF